MQWEDGRVKECVPTWLHAQTSRMEAPDCTNNFLVIDEILLELSKIVCAALVQKGFR